MVIFLLSFFLFMTSMTFAENNQPELTFGEKEIAERELKPFGKIISRKAYDIVLAIKKRLAPALPNVVIEIVIQKLNDSSLTPKERLNIVFEFLADPAYQAFQHRLVGALCDQKELMQSDFSFIEFAKKQGYSDQVAALLERCDPAVLTHELKIAVNDSNKEKIKELVTKGAHINIDLGNPLYFAVITQDIELVDFLLAHGADPQQLIRRMGGTRSVLEVITDLFNNQGKFIKTQVVKNFNHDLFSSIIQKLKTKAQHSRRRGKKNRKIG